jgi:L-alanine-DL-glutamate epimerase-like enolase superfamily enzyme
MRPLAEIVDLAVEALDLELLEPFGIATGAQHAAQNLLVTLRLDGGATGVGEAAPFPAVTGETQESARAAIERLYQLVVGRDAWRFRELAHAMAEAEPEQPSARAAIEMALFDALGKAHGFDLWRFFGAAEAELVTDITIVTGSAAHAEAAARRAAAQGFATLKIKVGGSPLEHDLVRLRAVLAAAPRARLVLDANASLSPEQAIALIHELGDLRERVALFEQPVGALDHAGLRRVREMTRLPVAADESARSAADVLRLAGTVDVVNLKLMKSGVVEALEMAAVARAAGMSLMMGGMVESALAMTVAACVAGGRGGFSFIDLDTPLFIRNAPFEGGFDQNGDKMRVDELGPGHGVARRPVLG